MQAFVCKAGVIHQYLSTVF